MTPRRSILYMPGANARAMAKAKDLPCDAIIFDLEDAVAPEAKASARSQVVESINGGGYGYRELIVRANGLDTPWGADDVQAVAGLDVDAVLFPKIERIKQVEEIIQALDAAGAAQQALWLMVETPAGILDLRAVAGSSNRIQALVLGTSDLVKELRAEHTESRSNIGYALQRCLLVARSLDLDILDGVHLDFRNLDTFRGSCVNAKAMGFDGKTLIHPSQIEIANEVFGIAADDLEHARAVLSVWQDAQKQGKGVAVLDGQLVENLHAAQAERTISYAEALEGRSGVRVKGQSRSS